MRRRANGCVRLSRSTSAIGPFFFPSRATPVAIYIASDGLRALRGRVGFKFGLGASPRLLRARPGTTTIDGGGAPHQLRRLALPTPYPYYPLQKGARPRPAHVSRRQSGG